MSSSSSLLSSTCLSFSITHSFVSEYTTVSFQSIANDHISRSPVTCKLFAFQSICFTIFTNLTQYQYTIHSIARIRLNTNTLATVLHSYPPVALPIRWASSVHPLQLLVSKILMLQSASFTKCICPEIPLHSTFFYSSHFPFCLIRCCRQKSVVVRPVALVWILHCSFCVLRSAASCVVFCVCLHMSFHSGQCTW